MDIYTGASFHIVNRNIQDPNELGYSASVDLGDIPEDVMNNEVAPLVKQLEKVLGKYNIHFWLTMGYYEDKSTDNEV